MTEYRFKKGERVPQWVEKVEPPGIDLHGTFGADVLVERHDDVVMIWPERELEAEECLMRFDGKAEGARITGAPTWGFMYPKGDPRNEPRT